MMVNEILVFAEQKQDVLTNPAKAAFGAAKELASNGKTISAVVIGKNINESINQCFALGAKKVYTFNNEQLEHYKTLPFTRVLLQTITDHSPTAVIFGYSTTSTDLAPRVAYSLDVASITGVTSMSWDGENLTAFKPAYSEKLNIKYSLKGKVKVVVLGIGAYPAPQADTSAKGEIIVGIPKFVNSDLVEEIKGVEVVEKTVDLSEAKLIVSGGRGVGNAEKFKVIYDTAEALGGQPASSRAVWDAGWTKTDIHVGQTGGSVAPEVYIACGISGAIQHVAGIKNSKTIIAVNTDPDAPIWEVAHYGIVGDLHVVLPLIAKKLQ